MAVIPVQPVPRDSEGGTRGTEATAQPAPETTLASTSTISTSGSATPSMTRSMCRAGPPASAWANSRSA